MLHLNNTIEWQYNELAPNSNNNKLRLLEENNDMLVFMAVGRRNRRAYINFDQDGRMIEYTGVVKL